MNTQTIRLNGTIDGISLFEDIGTEYCGLNIASDGQIVIIQAIPQITKTEIQDFLYRTVKFYDCPLSADIHALLIRNAFSMDFVLDPNLYSDNRIDLMCKPENELATMFQIDTSKNRVTGIRMIKVPQRIRETIAQRAYKILQEHILSLDIMQAYINKVLSFTPEDLEAKSTYLGCEESSIRTKEIVYFSGRNPE